MATVALWAMGAARAVAQAPRSTMVMTQAPRATMVTTQAPRATMVMTSTAVHQEEVSPPELKNSPCNLGSSVPDLRKQTVFCHFSDL
ncbi:Serine/arginine-rich splicing factor RS2Z32 [Zea mays]|uniref:Serine/arginine-rich splicing factor RS2Z32 n=1 Tax=Zea mays TaxID=4577 RepID=A0A1D6FVG9_MAIZE|nr:Serine/arginine-rich splicing factor RS2Z32 [Zea mays]AQK95439.1 Serine/arginine-rich splicing factor RS2Z32 [Zea mays]